MFNPTFARHALAGLTAAALIAGCGTTSPTGTAPGSTDVGSGQLTGAGSTFVDPFFKKAFYQYNLDHSAVSVNYQAIGSGAGIKAFIAGTVDFGASDVPMGATDITSAGGPDSLVQIPTTLGVVSVAYNVSGVTTLNLDGPTLAGIFLGTIKTWNDPAITALNAGTNLPTEPIAVVHRSDGSGTSYCFTDYLSKVSSQWQSGPGVGKSVQWPVGTGASGNQGVAAGIKSTEGAIGYVELAYVVQTGMHQAFIRNAAGKLLQGSVDGATAAAAQRLSLSPADFSITNEPGDASYPITTYSWAIIRKNLTGDAAKAKALVLLFRWLVTDGQAQGGSLQYAPIPKSTRDLATTALSSITAGGRPVLGS